MSMGVQNTINDIINNTTRTNYEKSQANMGKTELGQDAFLQLLMTQLKNQDPTNPMDTKDFMAQQAQFTTISEIQKLNKSLTASNQIMQASSLIGQEVTVQNPDNPKQSITGRVSEATMTSSGTNIVINDKEYPVSLIQKIKD